MQQYPSNTKRIGKRIMCTTRPESRAGRDASDCVLYSRAGYLHCGGYSPELRPF